MRIWISALLSICIASGVISLASADEISAAMQESVNLIGGKLQSHNQTTLQSAQATQQLEGTVLLYSVTANPTVQAGAFALSTGEIYPFFGAGIASILSTAIITTRTVEVKLESYEGKTYAQSVTLK